MAKFGFLALAVLWVVHALITLGASTTTTATPTFVLATVTPVAESNPARWAADPHGRHELRYWNGTAWTDDVSDRGVVSNETFRAAAPAAPRVEAPWASFDSETTVPRYAPPTTIPPTVAATPSVVLRFDSGLVHQLGGGVVVGRDPTLVAHVPAALLVQYADPTMSVSKTHLVLGPDGLDAWVEDLGSSNGTEVTTSGGHRIAVAPGQRLPVNRGATVHFGDRWVRVE